MKIPLLAVAGLILSVAPSCQTAPPAPHVGGYTQIADTAKVEVVEAAKFAVKAHSASQKANLKLVKVEKAESQVVAGMNYRMTLQVLKDGTSATADVVVWHQAWRKPHPYELTSWTWK